MRWAGAILLPAAVALVASIDAGGATPAVAGALGRVAATAVASDTITLRPTEVTLVMGNSRRYGGTYHAKATARICGYGPLRDMIGFVDGFTFMFPDTEDVEITDIDFNADTLPIGKTTTSFYISISLKAKDGSRPLSYVVRAKEPKYKETGTATVAVKGGTATLKVVGVNDVGETMDMTAVCKPQ